MLHAIQGTAEARGKDCLLLFFNFHTSERLMPTRQGVMGYPSMQREEFKPSLDFSREDVQKAHVLRPK